MTSSFYDLLYNFNNSPTKYQLLAVSGLPGYWPMFAKDYLEYIGLHISFLVQGYKQDPVFGINGEFLNWVELLSLEHVL